MFVDGGKEGGEAAAVREGDDLVPVRDVASGGARIAVRQAVVQHGER